MTICEPDIRLNVGFRRGWWKEIVNNVLELDLIIWVCDNKICDMWRERRHKYVMISMT